MRGQEQHRDGAGDLRFKRKRMRRFRVSTIERLVQLWCQTGADRGVRTTTDADTSLAVCGIRTTIYQKSALSNYSATLPVGLVMGEHGANCTPRRSRKCVTHRCHGKY